MLAFLPNQGLGLLDATSRAAMYSIDLHFVTEFIFFRSSRNNNPSRDAPQILLVAPAEPGPTVAESVMCSLALYIMGIKRQFTSKFSVCYIFFKNFPNCLAPQLLGSKAA